MYDDSTSIKSAPQVARRKSYARRVPPEGAQSANVIFFPLDECDAMFLKSRIIKKIIKSSNNEQKTQSAQAWALYWNINDLMFTP